MLFLFLGHFEVQLNLVLVLLDLFLPLNLFVLDGCRRVGDTFFVVDNLDELLRLDARRSSGCRCGRLLMFLLPSI